METTEFEKKDRGKTFIPICKVSLFYTYKTNTSSSLILGG